jgi:hypothetical protein
MRQCSRLRTLQCVESRRTFPGLSIGSSSSCFVAFAFPLPLAASVAVGFVTAAGFEKALVVAFAGAAFVAVDALTGFPFYNSRNFSLQE